MPRTSPILKLYPHSHAKHFCMRLKMAQTRARPHNHRLRKKQANTLLA